MKAVLISIRPEWARKILNGSKTVEIRKTAPKCGVPFKCYIYCTAGGKGALMVKANAEAPLLRRNRPMSANRRRRLDMRPPTGKSLRNLLAIRSARSTRFA